MLHHSSSAVALDIWWPSAARHLKYDDQVPYGTWNVLIKCHGTWLSYFKCRAALDHHISSATALDEWCNITMYYILHSTHNIYSYTWVYLHTLYTFIYFHIVSYIHSYTSIYKFNILFTFIYFHIYIQIVVILYM